jgi:hypothetical protein
MSTYTVVKVRKERSTDGRHRPIEGVITDTGPHNARQTENLILPGVVLAPRSSRWSRLDNGRARPDGVAEPASAAMTD